MCAGEDPWVTLSDFSYDNKAEDSLDPPEEDEDKGGTVLPVSAETKVESELSTSETIGTVLPETGKEGCALPE